MKDWTAAAAANTVVRKTKEDAELTRAALLDAAERVFSDKGVARTSLADIAMAAGVTRGAVYWHFKDKAELLQAMLSRALLPMEALPLKVDACPDADPLGALRATYVQALTALARSPAQQRVFGILFHKCENVGEVVDVMDHKKANQQECQQRVEVLLRSAVGCGQLPVDTDVPLVLQALNNFIVGTMREWLAAPNRYSLDVSAPALVDMVLAGLRTCPPRSIERVA